MASWLRQIEHGGESALTTTVGRLCELYRVEPRELLVFQPEL